jgi:hypothetical protein
MRLNDHRATPGETVFRALTTLGTIQEIEAAIPRLRREEVEALRAWIGDYLEDQLELKDEVKIRLDQSRREIYKSD